MLAVKVRLRRWFGTLQIGHVWKGQGEICTDDDLEAHYHKVIDDIAMIETSPAESFAGSTPLSHISIALENCPTTDRYHLQFYAEFKAPVWPKSLKEIFQSDLPPHCVREVKDPRGAYEYCTGTGRHHGKAALHRFQWGDARARGTVQDSRLKVAVDMIVKGMHPHDIAHHDAYAYACHSRKLWNLFQALRGKEIESLDPVDTIHHDE